ncbi:MAG TPA: hypothetical protein VJ461_02805 [Candidatus Nanoarchaeia archaeon]|nr:hypothetical protein [Candidatus Nanoarchaeia archaeon]
MGVDVRDFISDFNGQINELVDKTKIYFKSLTQYETIAWITLALGLILVIVALVMW